MPAIPRAIEWVKERIPDLESRVGQFQTEPFDTDDELVAAFCEELTRLGGDLQAALESGDSGRHRFAVHSLKGMFSSIGLPELAVLAQEIEWTLRDGKKERCGRLTADLIGWARDFTASYGLPE